MANIRVDLDYTIRDGLEIKFRSPVDCSQITGLIVYYPGTDGNTTSKVFTLADAHGNNVGDIDHLFAENVVVKVILDVTTGMAFVQNADTNAYLEAALAGKYPAVESEEYPGCYYQTANGRTEWINPPSALSVEYRTTERWNGKPVFTQLIDCGLSADKKQISYLNSEQILAVIRHTGRISGSVAPQANNNDWTNAWSLQFLVSTTSAGMRCGTSLVGKQTYLQIWYIKGAEFE